MTGGVVLTGILSHNPNDQRGFPERMAVLVGTLGYAFYYVVTALRAPIDAANPSLPDVPEGVLESGRPWGR